MRGKFPGGSYSYQHFQVLSSGSNHVKLEAKTDDDRPLALALNHQLIKSFMVVKELIASKTKMTVDLFMVGLLITQQ